MSNAISKNDSYLLIRTEVGIRGVVGIITAIYFDLVIEIIYLMIWINLWSHLRVTGHVIHSLQMRTVGLLPKMLLKSLISCDN